MDALGIKIEPTAGDATNSGVEQVGPTELQMKPLMLFHMILDQTHSGLGLVLDLG